MNVLIRNIQSIPGRTPPESRGASHHSGKDTNTSKYRVYRVSAGAVCTCPHVLTKGRFARRHFQRGERSSRTFFSASRCTLQVIRYLYYTHDLYYIYHGQHMAVD